MEVLGPAPAPVEKIRNLWRWHVILKGKKTKFLRKSVLEILETIRETSNVRVDVDVDPINLL